MPEPDITVIHKALVDLVPRAEKSNADLVGTFVDTEPLFRFLSKRANQIIYGRRGTGKTHALKYLGGTVEENGDRVIYIDLRFVGSNGSVYGDGSRSLSERASSLIRDVIAAIGDELYSLAVRLLESAFDPRQITLRLDDLTQAIGEVTVTGTVERETTDGNTNSRTDKHSVGGKVTVTGLSAGFGSGLEDKSEVSSERRLKTSGIETIHLNFGRVAACIDGLITVLGRPHIWLLLDEWSEVPIVLQPYLADLLRRIVLPQQHITVKIAAIEQRSHMALSTDNGTRIGLELGADIAAELNLDDFLVFDNNQEKSVVFFRELLFRHFKSSPLAPNNVTTAEQLTAIVFTMAPAFEEFVRAVEGVPRDAIYIFERLLTKAWGERFTKEHVRVAARDWYNNEKSKILRERPDLDALMRRIVDDVIGKRRARAFFFPSNIRNAQIDDLFDSRLLHILKRNVSSHEEPGARYDVFKIDFGCYVDLQVTTRHTMGLYEDEDGSLVQVPRDDHRSIRRAILRLPEQSSDLHLAAFNAP